MEFFTILGLMLCLMIGSLLMGFVSAWTTGDSDDLAIVFSIAWAILVLFCTGLLAKMYF